MDVPLRNKLRWAIKIADHDYVFCYGHIQYCWNFYFLFLTEAFFKLLLQKLENL